MTDGRWLASFCIARLAFGTMTTAYSGVLPLLKVDWNMTAAEAGLVQSSWHVGYLVSLLAAGFLTERFGAKRTLLGSSFAACVFSMLFALAADGFWSGLVLHFLAALFSGGSYTPGLTLLAERYRPDRRGRAMGYYIAASALGYALALVVAGFATPYIGWRGAFVLCALGPVAGTAIAFQALRATPNVVHPHDADSAAGPTWRAVLANKPAMLLIWAYVFHSWELLGMWAWLPAYLAYAATSGAAVTAEAVGIGALLSAITYVGSMIGSVYGGALSDRFGRTRVILIMSCASLACSLTLGWLVSLPLWLLVLLAVVYNITAIGDSSIYSTALTELVPPRQIGVAYSVRSLLGFGAGAVSPWAFGVVLDLCRAHDTSPAATWGLAWGALGLGALLGPFLTWKLRRMPAARQMANGKR